MREGATYCTTTSLQLFVPFLLSKGAKLWALHHRTAKTCDR